MYRLEKASRKFNNVISGWLVEEQHWKRGQCDPCYFGKGLLRGILSTDDFFILVADYDHGGKEQLEQELEAFHSQALQAH
jgi:hypothetical protein